LFDVGGTLITFDQARRAQAYADRAARVGVMVSTPDVLRVLDALDAELPARTQRIKLSLVSEAEQRVFWLDFWAEGFRRVGVPNADALVFADELLDSANGGNFQSVFEDTVPALQALKARGKQLGIISNWSPNCEPLLRNLGLADFFDFFVVSGILGIEKPDPRIFHAAIQISGHAVSELVYVGDSIFHDVEGARSVDMDAFLIDRANRYPQFEGARLRDLREL
jgi:putative hydrolase of the HAD superfamily